MDVSKFAALADGRLLGLERLTLFGRPGQRPAVQGGLRSTFNQERMDLDLLVGWQAGPNGEASLTLDFAVRG